jgi:tetratricopeptide (TPR) repeat protein
MNKQTSGRVVGWAIAGLSIVFFLAHVTWSAYPDEWSALLFSAAGQEPFHALSRPVWQGIMSVLSIVSGRHIVAASQLFNVICAALSVWMIFQIGYRIRRPSKSARSAPEEQRQANGRLVAGVVSAGFFMVTTPFFIIATRAHPLGLGMCLLLAAIWFSLSYRDQPRLGYWLAFAAVFGVGLAEFSTFILLTPFFLMWWIWLFWKSSGFSWGRIFGGAILLTAGISISFIFCWWYQQQSIAEWREFSSYWMVGKFYLIEMYQQIRYSVPKQGWLIVILTMYVPAFFIFWYGFEEADDMFTNIGLYFFRMILVAVAVILLFNLPGSPWRVIGSSIILVTPYAISALWVGRLVGFFYERLSWTKRSLMERRVCSAWPRRLLLGIALSLIALAGYFNSIAASPRHALPLIDVSRDILNGMDKQTYLISNGALDTLMKWELHKQDRPVRLINRARVASPVYMKHIATWFTDPALEGMASAGFSPLMDVWFSSTSNMYDVIAMQDLPEMWSIKGFEWRPVSGIYAGKPRNVSEMDTTATKISMEFVQRHRNEFGDESEKPELLKPVYHAVSHYLSVYANNLGYYLAEHGQWEEARKSFQLSLEYLPGNISTIINLGDLAERDGNQEEVKRLQDQFTKLTSKQSSLSLQHLTSIYGFARNPAIFLQEGLAMMQSGFSDIGFDRIRQALEFQGGHLPAELGLAHALYVRGQYKDSLEQYQKVCASNPENVSAWIGVSHCQLMLGDAAGSEQALIQLEKLGVPADHINMERGYVKLRIGDNREAIALFNRSMSADAMKGPSAIGMVWAALRLNDREYMEKALEQLRTLPDYYAGQIMLYQMAVNQRDLAAARQHIDLARKIQPSNVEVLEKSIQFELMEGNEAKAKKMLDSLLAVDANNSYGNYLLASVHDRQGRQDLAEAALRRAVVGDVRGDAHYGLAWILEKQGQYEEAMKLIDAALSRQPNNPQFVAVKGVLLNDLNRYDEAETWLKRAIQLRTDREIPLFKLNLAKVYINAGNRDAGVNILQEMVPLTEQMNSDERTLLDEVQKLAGE